MSIDDLLTQELATVARASRHRPHPSPSWSPGAARPDAATAGTPRARWPLPWRWWPEARGHRAG